MKKCKVCGNKLEKVPYKEQVYKGMGKWRNVTKYRELCRYCEWKGNTGAGAKLKSIIKEKNNGNI